MQPLRVTIVGSLSAVLVMAPWRPATAQQATPRCALMNLPRDTQEVRVYAVPSELKSGELRAEYQFRLRQAAVVLQRIEPVRPESIPGFISTGFRPDTARQQWWIPELEGELWFQVNNDGRLSGVRLSEPTDSPDLNRALILGALRADSARELLPLPDSLRDRPVDLFLRLQTRAPDSLAREVGRFVLAYVPVDSLPALSSRVSLRFPPKAYETQTGDSILISLVINESGAPVMGSARLRHASWREFAQEALAAVSRARFRPAMSGDCPIPMRVDVPVTFKFRR